MVELGCITRLAQFHLVLIAKVWSSISNDQQCDVGTSYNGIMLINLNEGLICD
jgi:hypothetical protein